MKKDPWPKLPYTDWKKTRDTLHRWIQIIGKVRTTQTPWTNHSWNSTLYVTSRGMTTSLIPNSIRNFSIDFDFIHHRLEILASDGTQRRFPLKSESVASFYERFCAIMSDLGITLLFVPRPNEVPDPIPFANDTNHSTYDPEAAYRFWQTLVQVTTVFQEFRSKFLGKCSPVHFFWGSLDLAVTRFSGRRAPEHPGGIPNLSDEVVKEAYSHEVSSCGFWPGNNMIPYPAFYSYAYPQPDGFETAQKIVDAAFYNHTLKEYILPYDEVRTYFAPKDLLLSFLQNTYECAANLGNWDRNLLEDSYYLNILQEKQKKSHIILRSA